MKIRWRDHEFVLATILAILVVAGFFWRYLIEGAYPPRAGIFESHHTAFNIWRNELLPDLGLVGLVYGAYRVFTRYLMAPLLPGRSAALAAVNPSRISRFLLQLLVLMAVLGTGIYIAVNYQHEWAEWTIRNLLGACLAVFLGTVVFILYLGLREGVILAIHRSGVRQNYWTLVCNQFTLFSIIYITIPFVVAVFGLIHDGEPIALYFSFTLPIFLVYKVATYWVFPLKWVRGFFTVNMLLRIIVTTFVCSLPFLLAPFHEGLEFGFLGCWAINLFVTTPIAWLLYQSRKDKIQQLMGVETALAKSTGDLQFLRSQINPHFLFNSLNTLYGFAIREDAGHTAGGIQKLGDMMRFMLEENTKDRISLEQEVEYLKNYISLQRMRIDTSSDITVETRLDPGCKDQPIAPMLLIPFVENAFKHGVSLDHRSWIRIDLQCLETNVVFEVRNSLHAAQGNDPEKDKKGIGNKNVIDRLNLIYPSTHSIRFSQSETEYTVHLTIQLK